MFVNTINSSFAVSSLLQSEEAGIQGGVATLIGQDLGYLGLDSFYSFITTGETFGTVTLDSFPSVDRNGVSLEGDDKQPLLLNSIHGYCLKVIPNEGAAATGQVKINITEIGTLIGDGANNHILAPGDSLVVMTSLGWPARALSSIELTEIGTLANCKVAFAIFGHSTNTALGYG